MRDKIKEYMKPLNELDKLIMLKEAVKTAIKDCNRRNKAVLTEFNGDNNRTGVRGGAFTTRAANAMKATDSYNKSIDYMKIVAENI